MKKDKQMKPNYGNIVTKKMEVASIILTGLLVVMAVMTYPLLGGRMRLAVLGLAGVGIVAGIWTIIWNFTTHHAFQDDSQPHIPRRIAEGITRYIDIPQGGVGLDVGCERGVLTIAAAKRFPNARMIGVDRWGKKTYNKFPKKLAEYNANCENADNVSFVQGNPLALPFKDETFDAVTANYAYSKIAGIDPQKLMQESLRTLKPGGCFAFHDQFTRRNLKRLQQFAKTLEADGYKDVTLISTTDGKILTKGQASKYHLKGSYLLCGRK